MAAADEVDAMYLDNLDEFINDENKVVTYRWLSTTLQVHVNQAKQMLYNFVIKQRNKTNDDDLNVTYFVAGLQKDEAASKVCRCEVVSEDKLDAIKSTFQKLYSCHIYSVQKSKLQESDALYITDYNLMKENIFDSCQQSSIKFNAAKRVVESKTAVESKPVVQEIKREVEPSFLDNDTKAKPESNGKASAPKKNTTNKTSAIAGMFAKASVKKESPKSSEQTANASKTDTKEMQKKNSTVSKKSPGVMSFFANATAKSKPKEEKPEEKENPIEEKPKEENENPIEEKTKEKPKEIKKETAVPKDKKRSVVKKKPASSDSDEDFVQQKKKRRRIKDDLFDSSSDEEEMEAEEPLPSPPPVIEEKEDEEKKDEEEMEEDDDEAPIPDTPDQKPKIEKKVQKEEPSSVTVTSDGRRRKHIKKKKKKTYLNDEGFMVTETVMESDSTDASDIEQPSKKPAETKKASPAAVAAKAHADKGKQKQSSLMSFFTKK